MNREIERIKARIMADAGNAAYTAQGLNPLFAADPRARVLVVGQAPGIKTQALGLPWHDKSGAKLRDWLGVNEAVFFDSGLFAQLPMDFYYPGKGKSGDLPPRRGFAASWHPQLLDCMPDVRLTLLIGSYAQAYYLGARRKASLTETVRAFHEYLPEFFPLVHPSPLNFRWQANNPWFEQEVLPQLKAAVKSALEAP